MHPTQIIRAGLSRILFNLGEPRVNGPQQSPCFIHASVPAASHSRAGGFDHAAIISSLRSDGVTNLDLASINIKTSFLFNNRIRLAIKHTDLDGIHEGGVGGRVPGGGGGDA